MGGNTKVLQCKEIESSFVFIPSIFIPQAALMTEMSFTEEMFVSGSKSHF